MIYILLVIAYAFYVQGMHSDITTRKFRNRTIGYILIDGIIFSIITQEFSSIYTFIAFALFTYVSLKLFEKNIIGAADLKVLSTSVFFINYFNFYQLYVFMLSLILCVFVFTMFYMFRMHGFRMGSWISHLRKEKYYLSELIYTKKFVDKIEINEATFQQTVPYTVPIASSIILSTFIIHILPLFSFS